jgi:hypothetical protein
MSMAKGDPSIVGAFGEDADGRRGLLVLVENPERFRALPRKQSKEQLHLDRFDADVRWGFGGDLIFDGARPGPDPPDFLVQTGEGEVGLEVTQFVLEDRAAAHAASRRLQAIALTRGPRRFRHLRGHVCYVAFDDRPLPPRDSSAWEAAVDALERVRPPSPPPKTMDEFAPEAIEPFEGGVISACPLMGPTRRSAFYNVVGFELSFPWASVIYEDDAFSRLQRLVTQHDQPGVIHLVVSISAPVVDGWAYPSDGQAAALAQGVARTKALSARHIELIWLHYWPTRTINLIVANSPGLQNMCEEEAPSGWERRLKTGLDPTMFADQLTEEERSDWERWMTERFGPGLEGHSENLMNPST